MSKAANDFKTAALAWWNDRFEPPERQAVRRSVLKIEASELAKTVQGIGQRLALLQQRLVRFGQSFNEFNGTPEAAINIEASFSKIRHDLQELGRDVERNFGEPSAIRYSMALHSFDELERKLSAHRRPLDPVPVEISALDEELAPIVAREQALLADHPEHPDSQPRPTAVETELVGLEKRGASFRAKRAKYDAEVARARDVTRLSEVTEADRGVCASLLEHLAGELAAGHTAIKELEVLLIQTSPSTSGICDHCNTIWEKIVRGSKLLV